MPERLRPKIAGTTISPNQSARSSSIRGIVIHSTESHNRRGLSDLQAVAGWFRNPASQVSAHVIDDAKPGVSWRCVKTSRKAWHCGAYNSATVGIEQIGFAAYVNWKDSQLRETARWIARLSQRHGVPIRRGRVSGGYIVRTGVLTHAQLGRLGGGHTDPGHNYPLDRVLALAREYRSRL